MLCQPLSSATQLAVGAHEHCCRALTKLLGCSEPRWRTSCSESSGSCLHLPLRGEAWYLHRACPSGCAQPQEPSVRLHLRLPWTACAAACLQTSQVPLHLVACCMWHKKCPCTCPCVESHGVCSRAALLDVHSLGSLQHSDSTAYRGQRTRRPVCRRARWTPYTPAGARHACACWQLFAAGALQAVIYSHP